MYEYAIQFWDGEYLENYANILIYTTDKPKSAMTFTYPGAEKFIASRGWKGAKIVKVL